MQQSIIRAIFETFAPPEASGERGAEGMREAIGALAQHRARELHRFITLIATIGFAHWTQRARERFLRALGDSPIPALRTAFQALKRLALFVAYADERNPLWDRLAYPGPRSDVPRATISVPSVVGATGRLRADAIVIGSGAGGSVAAALLARSGRKTIVFEAGPAFEETARSQLERRATQELFLGAGAAATSDLGISLLAGGCVGGGTTVNWSTSLRLTAKVAAQWEQSSGISSLGSELESSYAAVEDRLQLVATSEHNRNNAVIVRGCTALDWEVTTIPRNASGCGEGCGYCGFGCAYGKKRGTATTYLRDAVEAGARIYAGTAVARVRTRDGRVLGVDAEHMSVDAPLVVVAAGSLRTPGVLSRSGVVSPHLGRHLKLHPTLPLVAEFEEPIETWHGPIQTALCERWCDLDDGYGAVIEACPAHPAIFASATPWRNRAEHAEMMLRARNCATLIVLTRDRGEGRVSLEGRDDVDYVLAQDDAARMLEVAARGVELALAAGAIRVAVPFTVPLELRREDATQPKIAAFAHELRARSMRPNRVALFSAHQMGTARMHADPTCGVVDARGRVHGVEGLVVADASVFPLSSGVNPMLTIMALAHRALVQETPVREGTATLRT